MKRWCVLILGAGLLTGCDNSNEVANEPLPAIIEKVDEKEEQPIVDAMPEFVSTEEVEAEIQAALIAVNKANELGYEWRDTRNLIKNAEAALATGDDEQAMKFAKLARLQGEASIQQAEAQKNAKPPF